MLNRFRNAVYGSSNTTDEDTTSARLDYDCREAVISKRIRSALTRSSSFREDLLRDSGRNRSNNNNGLQQGKGQVLSCSTLANQHSDNQYSYSVSRDGSRDRKQSFKSGSKVPKFHYSRPEFLQLRTEDEILVSADHQIRPIILSRDVSRLPWKSGYAECINAGKSIKNEDQASCYQDVIIRKTSTLSCNDSELEATTIESQLPWVYYGIFDGHAGTAVAVAAAAQLHNIIGEKLHQVADLLIALEFEMDSPDEGDREEDDEYIDCTEKEDKSTPDVVKERTASDSADSEAKSDDTKNNNNLSTDQSISIDQNFNQAIEQSEFSKLSIDQKSTSEHNSDDSATTPPNQSNSSAQRHKQNDNNRKLSQDNFDRQLPSLIDICRNNISVDSLVIGALESAFWEMDELIAQDKHMYKMAGGCTAIVSLFILGKLYVCNAGDSRAIVYKNNQVIPMSFDFTPTSERQRILRLGMQRPEFMGNEFTHLEFIRRPTRRDLGKQMLYKDAYMTGWSLKTITYDDLRIPLVWGEGKRSRVLATIGVTRGFGDHELRAQYGSILIKPFLTPEPEVKVLPLESDDSLAPEDVLIIGSDGLWDVTSNQEAADIVKNSFDLFPDNEESRSKYRYITAAQDLVIHSRGHTTNWNSVWRTSDDKLASLDDIAVFVIPLKQYRDEYLEWKRLRCLAKERASGGYRGTQDAGEQVQ